MNRLHRTVTDAVCGGGGDDGGGTATVNRSEAENIHTTHLALKPLHTGALS